MAVEVSKVKAVLDTKFKGKPVSKELKDAYAKRWAQKIDTDEDIQTYVDDREDDVLDASKEADRRATAAEKLGREKAAKAASGNTETEDDTNTETEGLPADTPPWVKQLMKQNQDLAAKVSKLESDRSAETLESRFRKDERLKGVPEVFLKRAIPTTEEGYEQAVTDLAADFKTFAEENQLKKFGNDNPPSVGGGSAGTGAGSGKVDPDIVAYAKAKAAETTKTTS